MDKSIIPIFFLDAIKLDIKSKIITLNRQKEEIATLQTVPNSSHYFVFHKNNIQEGKDTYVILRHPASEVSISVRQVVCFSEQVVGEYNHWIELIKKFNNIKKELEFDDPFVETYFREIDRDFKIVDEDANYAPYETIIQEEIRKRLDTAVETVKQYETEENKSETTEIINIATELSNKIHRSTKTQVANGLKEIIARAKKISPKLGNDLVVSLLVDGIKWAGVAAYIAHATGR